MNSLIPNDFQLADNIQGSGDAQNFGIPREAIMDTVPRSALAATKKIVNLIPISANQIGPSQSIQFLIPQRNMMKAHSTYLKFRCRVSTTAIGRTFSFSGAIQSAASLFNNITLQAGGAVIESLQNYHVWHNNIVGAWSAHTNERLAVECLCSGSSLPYDPLGKFVASGVAVTAVDASACKWNQDGAGYYNQTNPTAQSQDVAYIDSGNFYKQFVSVADGAGSGICVDFSIPIYAGFFNPKESQLVPLQFINGGVLMTIQTNPISKAFFGVQNAGVDDVSNYVLDNFELCYAEISPANEYITRVRTEMAGSKQIRIEAQSYQNYIMAAPTSGGAISQVMNANLTSLSALFWGIIQSNDTYTSPKVFQDKTADGDTNTYYEVLFDNVALYQSVNRLNIITARIRQLQEALGSTVSDVPVAPHTIGRGDAAGTGIQVAVNPAPTVTSYGHYADQNALFGLSTKLFASNSVSMDGMPVDTLTFNFRISTVGSGALIYAFLVYDYVYTVNALGAINKYA